MKYLVTIACLFGLWCFATRFVPGLVMGISAPILVLVGLIAGLYIASKVK